MQRITYNNTFVFNCKINSGSTTFANMLLVLYNYININIYTIYMYICICICIYICIYILSIYISISISISEKIWSSSNNTTPIWDQVTMDQIYKSIYDISLTITTIVQSNKISIKKLSCNSGGNYNRFHFLATIVFILFLSPIWVLDLKCL